MKFSIRFSDKLIELDEPLVMGIVNITPDSFYEGSRFEKTSDIIQRIEEMIQEGAHIIDVGAASSRPGSPIIDHDEEIRRLADVVPQLKKKFPDTIFSIDTYHANTASYALDHGFDMVNDISGGNIDPNMINLIISKKVPYILMHMQGTPATMQQFTHYDNILESMAKYFSEKINHFHSHGFFDIIIDPGFGFSKTLEQNYFLLKHLDFFHIFKKPIAIGVSRKSMIYRILQTDPSGALEGTLIVQTLALLKGIHILRVHDIKPTVDLIKIFKNYQYA
ncbi:MAG: dihydropteroate synthase [Bacteroidales bacterium]|nr:dihydropteroate synthase [Bacteroidales bacterium]